MDDIIQRILIAGDATSALRMYKDLTAATSQYRDMIRQMEADAAKAGTQVTGMMRGVTAAGVGIGASAYALLELGKAGHSTVEGFGKTEEALLRVQHQTGATNAELGSVGNTRAAQPLGDGVGHRGLFARLSARTEGEAVGEMGRPCRAAGATRRRRHGAALSGQPRLLRPLRSSRNRDYSAGNDPGARSPLNAQTALSAPYRRLPRSRRSGTAA